MIYLGFPLGTTHGWGVCGRMITRELSRLTQVELYTQAMDPGLVIDTLELVHLISLLPPGSDPRNPPPGHPVDSPVLRGVQALKVSFRPELRGPFNVGYTFFEENLPPIEETTLKEYDHIVGGSTWCADRLREAGVKSVSVILQGVDPRHFNAMANEKQYFRDRFVIFSGGKLEFRKGQDVVIRAFQILQQRHRDVMLINAWHNPWNWNANTIGASKYIRVPSLSGNHVQVINQLLAHNGVDVSAVISLPAMPNPLMADVYKNTDVGLFLSRCEGGTNLVMMEYMACGKTAIAARHTGHTDIVTDENSLPLRNFKPQPIHDQSQKYLGDWLDPNLDEVVERLEYAYQNRDALRPLAQRGADDLANLTWANTAQQFYDLLMAGK